MKAQIKALKASLIAILSIMIGLSGAFCAKKYGLFDKIKNLTPSFDALRRFSSVNIPMTIDERPQTAQTFVEEDVESAHELEPLVSVPQPILSSAPAEILPSEPAPALESDSPAVEIGM